MFDRGSAVMISLSGAPLWVPIGSQAGPVRRYRPLWWADVVGAVALCHAWSRAWRSGSSTIPRWYQRELL